MGEQSRQRRDVIALAVATLFLACAGDAPRVSDPSKAPAISSAPADTDADGVADGEDKCPTAAEDKDQFEDADGCPDPDNDGDKIADKDDKCPDSPEDFNGYEDTDGCPDCRRQIHVHPASIKVFERIYFDSAAIKLKPVNFPIIDSYALIMQQHPELRVLEVQGHADATEKGAQQLSLQRAQIVLDELVKRGVDRGRLKAVGYAATRPLAGGKTPAELAKNRRVELFILEHDRTETKPSAGGPPPCP